MCIDNPEVRKIVKKHIQKVPSVMVKIDSDIELYEGQEAYEWLTTFSEQLYNQLESVEEKKNAEINARIEAEAHALAEAKLLEMQSSKYAPAQPLPKNVKSRAKLMAQERTTNLSFADEPAETGASVSQVKTDTALSISEQVKNMEQERNRDEAEIQKNAKLMPTL